MFRKYDIKNLSVFRSGTKIMVTSIFKAVFAYFSKKRALWSTGAKQYSRKRYQVVTYHASRIEECGSRETQTTFSI